MMKAYINIKNNSNLHTHQTLNKRIGLMKRESKCSPTHHFSFSEPFDETMMKVYYNVYQCVKLSNHQFIKFSHLIKSAVETAAQSLPVCPKRERQRQAADAAAGFWRTKSHSLLGRFLHAPLTLMLKTPQ